MLRPVLNLQQGTFDQQIRRLQRPPKLVAQVLFLERIDSFQVA